MKKNISALFYCALLLWSCAVSTRAADSPMVTLVVTLEGEPAMVESGGAKSAAALAQASIKTKLRGRKIKSQHDALQSKLEATGAKVVWRTR
jgi:hypothetical protein